MTAELGDKRAVMEAFREATGEIGREQITEAVEDAVRMANQALRQVGESPPPDASMDEWAMESIIDSVEVYWRQGKSEGKLAKGDALVAEWTHPHADKIEFGVKPHLIEGDPLLIFEWHDIPDDVAEQFQSAWDDPNNFLEEPMVAFTEVNHPGIPAVGYARSGFQRALRKYFS